MAQKQLKSSKKRKPSSTAWLKRQLNDPYVRATKNRRYRSRAAFKLLEMDARHTFLGKARRIIDLGSAPGSWCQVVLEKCPGAQLAGIDLLPIEPLGDLTVIHGDFRDQDKQRLLITALSGPPCVILSDMAPNTIGHKQTDHLRSMALVEEAAAFACEHLKPEGSFITKIFSGGGEEEFVKELRRVFSSVKYARPKASRQSSREIYIIAKGKT